MGILSRIIALLIIMVCVTPFFTMNVMAEGDNYAYVIGGDWHYGDRVIIGFEKTS